MSFLEYHMQRTEKVDSLLREFAEKLKNRGNEVFAPERKFIDFIVVIKENKSATLEYHEVPYSWVVYIDKKPDRTHGSSIEIKELPAQDLDAIPFTEEDIENFMAEKYDDLLYLIKL